MHHLINHTLFNIVNKEQLFTSENKDLNCKAIHLVAKMNDLNSHLAMWYLDHHHQQGALLILVDLLMICTISPNWSNWRKWACSIKCNRNAIFTKSPRSIYSC